jgi:hypothetical protein
MAPNNGELFCRLARQILALYIRAHCEKRINLKKPVLLQDCHPQHVETPTEYQTSQNREGSTNNHIMVREQTAEARWPISSSMPRHSFSMVRGGRAGISSAYRVLVIGTNARLSRQFCCYYFHGPDQVHL